MVTPCVKGKHENTRPAVMLSCSVYATPRPLPCARILEPWSPPLLPAISHCRQFGHLTQPVWGAIDDAPWNWLSTCARGHWGGKGRDVDVVLGLQGFVRAWASSIPYVRADSSYHATAVFSQTQLRRLKQRDLCAQLPVALFLKNGEKTVRTDPLALALFVASSCLSFSRTQPCTQRTVTREAL